MHAHGHRVTTAIVIALTLAGCSTRPREDAGSAQTLRETPTADRWHPATWLEPGAEGPRDRGHGVIHHADGSRGVVTGERADTTWLHSAPDSTSPLAGVFITNAESPEWLRTMEIRAPDSLVAEQVEFDYEEYGIPYDSIDASGMWHRLILGYTSSGERRHGWLAFGGAVLERQRWIDILPQMPLFFVDSASGSFHLQPGGSAVAVPPAVAAGDFDMTSVELRWPWLRMKVEYPGRMCDDPPTDRQVAYYWIRALDERGRPRAFYYTRGC